MLDSIYSVKTTAPKFHLAQDQIADIIFHHFINNVPQVMHDMKISKNFINKVVHDYCLTFGNSNWDDVGYYRSECLKCEVEGKRNRKINQHITQAILQHYPVNN